MVRDFTALNVVSHGNNELVDRLAKEATVEDGPVVYDKMPREVIITGQKENGLRMWQWQ